MAARDPRANCNCGRCPSLFIRPNHVTCEASQNKRLAQRVYATGRDRSRVNPTIYDTTVRSSSHHTRHTDRRLPLLVCTPRGPTSYTQRTSPTSRQVWSFRNLRHTRCTCIRYLPATTNLSLIHGRISDANISISHRNTSIYCVI